MLVKILLFARLRDIAGRTDLERQLPEPATAQTAWNVLAQEFPELAAYNGTVSCAVNEVYARFTTALHDGDEVAFLPPVSGGEHYRSACGPSEGPEGSEAEPSPRARASGGGAPRALINV